MWQTFWVCFLKYGKVKVVEVIDTFEEAEDFIKEQLERDKRNRLTYHRGYYIIEAIGPYEP